VKPDNGNNKTTEKHKTPKKRGRGESNNTSRGDRNVGNKKSKLFCTEHVNNPATHPTSDCWTLKNRKPDNSGSNTGHNGNSNRSFSNKSFRKELHMLSKKSSKKEVLDMYASAIQKERVKLANIKKKRRSRAQASAQSSDSDSSGSDVSVGVVEPDNDKKRSDIDLPNGKKRSKAKTKKSSSQLKSSVRKTGKTDTVETMAEEKAYQKTVKNASEDST
jgi:hypothetical protein